MVNTRAEGSVIGKVNWDKLCIDISKKILSNGLKEIDRLDSRERKKVLFNLSKLYEAEYLIG